MPTDPGVGVSDRVDFGATDGRTPELFRAPGAAPAIEAPLDADFGADDSDLADANDFGADDGDFGADDGDFEANAFPLSRTLRDPLEALAFGF